MFKTLKQAAAAGYRRLKPGEYAGGPPIQVKGRNLVHGGAIKTAVSATEWHRCGYQVRAGEAPHAVRSAGYGDYGVYRHDQVEPRRQRGAIPPPVEVPLLAALWAINRHAKRLRDRASDQWEDCRRDLAASSAEQKRRYYRWKGQVLAHLLAEGRLVLAGHHRFRSGLWAEVLTTPGDAEQRYTFHRPCPAQADQPAEDIDRIEAKPRRAKEPRLCDATLTIRLFLAGKEELPVYEWPAPVRARAPRWAYWFDEDEEEDDDWPEAV